MHCLVKARTFLVAGSRHEAKFHVIDVHLLSWKALCHMLSHLYDLVQQIKHVYFSHSKVTSLPLLTGAMILSSHSVGIVSNGWNPWTPRFSRLIWLAGIYWEHFIFGLILCMFGELPGPLIFLLAESFLSCYPPSPLSSQHCRLPHFSTWSIFVTSVSCLTRTFSATYSKLCFNFPQISPVALPQVLHEVVSVMKANWYSSWASGSLRRQVLRHRMNLLLWDWCHHGNRRPRRWCCESISSPGINVHTWRK